MTFLAQIKFLHLTFKDLKAEFRTKQMLNSMMIFALIVMVIFSFAFGEADKKTINYLAPGILWIAFTFAGMLGLSRSFAGEMEEGCLDGLKLCPIDRSSIYLGKAVSNTILMFIMELVTVPLFIVLFNYEIKGLPGLILIILLGTFGFITVGTLLSALTVNTRTREILLPVIIFPVIIPLLISAVGATGKMLTGSDPGEASSEIQILAVYDAILFVVAQLVFEYVIED